MSAGRHALAALAALAIIASLVPHSVSAATADPGRAEERSWTLAEPAASNEALATAWFIELKSPPASRGTPAARLAQERNDVRAQLTRAGVRFSERFAFETLWNGISVDMLASDAGIASRQSGVKAIYPVATFGIPTVTSVSEPELVTALAQTGADAAYAAGYKGAGIRVAVMDSGVDYHHPDLGGCFGAGCRVVTGKDFVGDLYNSGGATPRETTPRPDPDPDDCNGHGTHVAGIIGASGDPAISGGARGVAPEVVFGAYRVFGCVGSTSADIMIAAMERALADGMHVLNMSIGSSFQWPSYPTAVASNNAVAAGMVVVASIGNSGANGTYSSSSPGNGDKVIGVASFDNTHLNLPYFTVTPDDKKIGYQSATGSPLTPTSGTLPLSRTATSATADGCTSAGPLPTGLAGTAVLIKRGTCGFHEKAVNAQNAGAAAVILYNNVAGRISATVAGPTAITIPVVSITLADGTLIDGRIAAGPVSMTWSDGIFTETNATGNRISSFSSYGHAPDLSLKPDIGAPGGFIRSTWPLENGTYRNISGTSMASPHVAGAVALYLAAHPGTAAGDVRTILQNSADPKERAGTPAGLDNVHRQGAGMLDIPGSIEAAALITPGKLALREVAGGVALDPIEVTIRNTGTSAQSFTLSHEAALATSGSNFTPVFSTAAATVTFSSSSVDLAAGASAKVKVTITPPGDALTNLQFGGYLVATSGGESYRVPYAGFSGDYQAIAALTATVNGFPWLAKRTGVDVDANAPIRDFAKQSAGATYTFKTKTLDDIPWLLFHLDHQVSRLTVDLYEEGASTPSGLVLDLTDFGRNSAVNGVGSFFRFAWSGKTADTSGPNAQVVKDGSYFFKITVLKALGDPGTASHLESWTSPVFNVLREGDETAPKSDDVRVSTNAAPTSQLNAGDAFKVVFSELMLAPTTGSTISVQDGDASQAVIVCGTNATCRLNSTDEAVGGTTYASGSVLTVTLSASFSATGGATAGLQLPVSIVSSSITDRAQNGWDLAGSADVVIDVE